jgi:hypothetical protein
MLSSSNNKLFPDAMRHSSGGSQQSSQGFHFIK